MNRVAWVLWVVLGVVVVTHGLDIIRYALGIPVYHLVDYDPGITRDAAKVKPVIAALDRYHHHHGRFPTDLSQLAPYLPSRLGTPDLLKNNFVAGWEYYSYRDKYWLHRKMGHYTLPPLYEYEGSNGRWFWDTGKTKIPIRLNP
jgi:hypothetical protein